MGAPVTTGFLAAILGAVALTIAPLGAQSWTNATGSLAYKVTECGTLTLVSPVPGSDAIIAGLAGRGLWVNTGGTAWTRLTDPEGERVGNRPTWIVYDPDNPNTFWESGIYGPGVYKTTDGGKTVARLGTIDHNDFVSVDTRDPERRTILAGGHEQGQLVHLSTDGGKTWRNIGKGLPAGSGHSSFPFVVDAQTFLIGIGNPPQHPLNGIYRSADGGSTWRRVAQYGAMGPPLRTANGIIYWTAPEWLLRSTDNGATWTPLRIEGLRTLQPVDVGGRLVVATKSHLLISAADGSTWAPLGGPLPYSPDGLAYSEKRKAFFIWKGECKENVSPNSLMMLDLAARTPSR